MPRISHPGEWLQLQGELRRVLPSFLLSQRWYGGKTRTIRSIGIVDVIPIPLPHSSACIFLEEIHYSEGASETYVIPLLERLSNEGASADERPTLRIQIEGGAQHVLTDALWDPEFLSHLLKALASGRGFSGANGRFSGRPTAALQSLIREAKGNLEPSRMKAEQSNSSILYGQALVLKFFRRMEPGINPDYEMGEFLSQQAGFSHVPAVGGAWEYLQRDGQTSTLGILQTFVANQGDAWRETLRSLSAYYDRAERNEIQGLRPGPSQKSLLAESAAESSSRESESLGPYRSAALLLGQRTAELHVALASNREDAAFAPERFSLDYQRGLCDSMTRLTEETLAILRDRAAELPLESRGKADSAISLKNRILDRFQRLRERPLTGLRTRVHGDFHLGQVLCSGDDFVFIDFEGEPVRSLMERREKHSPLRDVAGMLRSFHYAAYAALFQRAGEATGKNMGISDLWPFAGAWYRGAATEYLRGYLSIASRADFFPSESEESAWLLDTLLLEKAVYELRYELGHRLSWIRIPLEGITDLFPPSA